MTQSQPEALRLAHKYDVVGFVGEHRFAQDKWCRDAAAELRRQHARIEELEAQLSAIGVGGVEPLHKAAKTEGDATDWEEIALALAQRVNFAITNLSCNGYGMINVKPFNVQTWREYMADGLEMIPGVAIDREMLATLELSPAQRKKAQAEITTKRAAQPAPSHHKPAAQEGWCDGCSPDNCVGWGPAAPAQVQPEPSRGDES